MTSNWNDIGFLIDVFEDLQILLEAALENYDPNQLRDTVSHLKDTGWQSIVNIGQRRSAHIAETLQCMISIPGILLYENGTMLVI